MRFYAGYRSTLMIASHFQTNLTKKPGTHPRRNLHQIKNKLEFHSDAGCNEINIDVLQIEAFILCAQIQIIQQCITDPQTVNRTIDIVADSRTRYRARSRPCGLRCNYLE